MTDVYNIKTDTDSIVTPIVENNGISIYPEDIENLEIEYINTLPTPEQIYKVSAFQGLLEYIYNNKLKRLINRKWGERIDFYLMDNIFKYIYIPLCRKYDKSPKLITFSNCLVNIDNCNLTDIKSGLLSNNNKRASQTDVRIVKKWYETCEGSLSEKAIEESSIGSMFALKALYGWKENNTITIEQSNLHHETAEQIQERHKTASLPEMPEI